MPGSESIYQPVHTISDLRRKLALASYLMSFRPIFQKNSDLYMYPRLFTHLHTDPIRITGDFILVISKLQEQIVEKLAETRANSSEIFKQALLDYLKSSSVRFKPEVQGERNKKGLTGLYPEVNDVVIYKDHNNLPRFGIIKKVFGKNKVLVRTVSYTDRPGQPPRKGIRRCRRCGIQLC